MMKLPIISIGNSKGLRLSKTILERYDIQKSVELILEEDQIIIKPIANPREGWEEAFLRMHEAGDDELVIDDVFEDEQFDEWK